MRMDTSGRTVAVAVALLTAAGASPVHAGLVPATSTGDVPGPSTSSSALAMPASATLATAVPVPLPARRSSPLSQSAQASLDEAAPVVVASKPFAESYVLAEIFAQLLEARGIEVDRRFGLGGTEIAFRALREGAIDLYPEYTGTGLAAILGEVLRADAETLYRYVVQTFRERWDVRWLAPLGFENTYAMAVRRETAERLGLRTLSDLAREAGQLRAGFTPDFIGRSDGLPGLREAYGFEPAEVHPLLQAIKYEALVESGVDVIDGYSTDGLIARYDLVVLEDNLRFFPPYQAAALTNGDFWSRRPDAIAALSELSGLLGVERMREWNRRAEEDGEPVSDIARDALAEIGLVVTDRAEVTGPAPRRGGWLRGLHVAQSHRPPAPRAPPPAAGRRLPRCRRPAGDSRGTPAGAGRRRRGGGHPRHRRRADHPEHRPARLHDPRARDRGRPGRGRALPLFALSDPAQHLHRRTRRKPRGGGRARAPWA